jgi:hypothetical protein
VILGGKPSQTFSFFNYAETIKIVSFAKQVFSQGFFPSGKKGFFLFPRLFFARKGFFTRTGAVR